MWPRHPYVLTSTGQTAVKVVIFMALRNHAVLAWSNIFLPLMSSSIADL